MKGRSHLSAEEITAYLDGELELGADRSEHLKFCPECAGCLKERRKLRRMALGTKPEVPTERMWRVIEARLREEPASHPGFWTVFLRSPRWLAASATGAVAGALLAIVIVRDTGETPGKGLVATPAPERAVEKKADRRPDPRRRPETKDAVASAPAPDEPEPAAAEDEGTGAVFREDAASRPAPETAVAAAPARRGRKRADSAAAPARAAPEGTAAPSGGAAVRASYPGERFLLEADRLDYSRAGAVVASGRVVVRPATPGGAYFAVVDGLSRTLTGAQEGVSVEILQPGERLTIQTR